jgi:peroxiredoxin Q/BCP
MTVETGKKAPDFSLLANTGEKVKLSDYKGKNVVLYFYPKGMKISPSWIRSYWG